ncbi:MAG TPA: type II toxin-antitoxin system PemK/MazF family toxin [Phenylobacterium sp.]
MTFATFDVVVVPFPYSDRLAEKRRPALVVSAPILGRDLSRIWVAMITSDRGLRLHGDAEILDLTGAGLPVSSVLRASKVATIEADRVLRRAGALSEADRTGAIAALKACAGF